MAQDIAKIQRDSVWIETSNGTIFGILYSPSKTSIEKLPAILCLQGGGNVGLANYTYEANYFAKQGWVGLVCDKSGQGLSMTKKRWDEQSFSDKILEYSELIDWLNSRPNVDVSRVGVHGMSEGGRLALNLAAEYPDKIAFVNSVSGPIESYKENQLYAISKLFNRLNLDPEIAKEALEVWDTHFSEVAKKNISTETVSRIDALREKAPDLRYLPASTTELPPRPLPEDVHFSLEDKMSKINCPVLFQFGEWDNRVNPVRSLELIPKKEIFDIRLYPKTDHSMNLENGDMNPLFLDDKKEWLTKILMDL